jgi:hypothetical protein
MLNNNRLRRDQITTIADKKSRKAHATRSGYQVVQKSQVAEFQRRAKNNNGRQSQSGFNNRETVKQGTWKRQVVQTWGYGNIKMETGP